MNLANTIRCFGTPEGALKGWDTRGRGRKTEWNPNWGQQTQTFYQNSLGHYRPSRVRKHDELVRKFENKPAQINPVVRLTAGGTASGKTVASKTENKDLRDPAIVNMDMPRSELPEFKKCIGTNRTGLLQEEASDIRDKILMSALAHNNDIALDAVGSPGLAEKLDKLENAGYQVKVSYIHRPVEESVYLADKRGKEASNPADRRIIPESVTRASHAKSRGSLELLAKPGRELKIYDGTNKWNMEPYDVIYHRLADGTVKVKNDAALERMRNSEEPKIKDIF